MHQTKLELSERYLPPVAKRTNNIELDSSIHVLFDYKKFKYSNEIIN